MHDFPTLFPTRLEPVVDAEILRISLAFPAMWEQRDQRILASALAFAEIGCSAAEQGEWRVDLANSGIREFIRTVHYHDAVTFGYRWENDEADEVQNQISKSKDWLPYLERLAKVGASIPTKSILKPQLPPPIPDIPPSRKGFIEPLLRKKGWSIEDWANASKVADRTARDYLNGSKSTYRSNRRKLAESLGLSAGELPD